MEAIVSVDTNVLVRFLVDDEARSQCEAAKRVFNSSLCFVSESVLLETEWVLRAVYQVDRAVIARGFRALMRLENVTVPDVALLKQVLTWFERGFDFADALHLARSEGHPLRTFDRQLVKQAIKEGFEASVPR